MMINSNLNKKENFTCKLLPSPLGADFKFEVSMFFKNLYKEFPSFPDKSNFCETGQKLRLFPEIEKSDEESEDEMKVKDFIRSSLIKVEPDFKIVIDKFDQEIFKGKYFNLKVVLQPLNEKCFPVNQSLDVEVLMLTNENVLITKNMRGQDIVRGSYLGSLKFNVQENRHSTVLKIQVTEVSSHFIGKTVSLKVKVRKNEFLANSGFHVQSALLKNLSIKAKKSKFN
jgi:hypothetical protein